MTEKERQYLLQRAGNEIAMAQDSPSEAAVQAHYRLAEAYLKRIYDNGASSAAEGLQ